MILESTLTCPRCGHRSAEIMPTDACQFFYQCKGCGERLKPLPGDCCVFCSYGSVPCPPIQAGDPSGTGCCGGLTPARTDGLLNPDLLQPPHSETAAFAAVPVCIFPG